MMTPSLARILRSGRRSHLMVAIIAWALVLALGAAHQARAGESAVSQCVTCHTDAAKLKALTPPDPPPSEEGEG